MTKALAASAFFALLVLLALSAACGGGDGGSSAIDIKDFDTARFTMTQTQTTGGNELKVTGEGVIDNRQAAMSVTYQGGPGGQTIAIGRTVYSYDEQGQRWERYTEPTDGQVGFGRPYWPRFWVDAVQVEELGGQSLQGVQTTGYRLSYDREKVKKHLGGGTLEVGQAQVEVWVDDSTRYAVQLTFLLQLTSGAQTTRVEIVSTFSDYGAEVQIEAPKVGSPTPAATGAAPTEVVPTEAVATAAPTEP